MPDFQKRRRALYALATAVLAFWPAFSCAGTSLSYTDGDRPIFSIEVPDFWTARVGGDRRLTPPGEDAPREVKRVIGLLPEQDAGVWVGFSSPAGVRNLAEGEEYARAASQFIVKDPEITKVETRSVSGYPARVAQGNGRRDGRRIHFTAMLIDLPNGRVVFSLTVLAPGYDAAALEDVNAIYNSIQAK